MPLRRPLSLLPHLFLLLLLCAAGTAARAGDTYTFAGNAVNGCTLSAKTYTCPALPLPNWNDKVVISGGYTVTANGDVTFGYDQGLAISGGGTLRISGNLDIGNIQTSLLQVNGATLVAGKTFSMGAQVQTIVADISAATMNLGTGSQTKITGKIAATGAVNIASNTTIVGPISGTTIVTTSPVSLTGDVTATTRFYLASHSTIKGNIVAPTVETDSPVTINGNVTATQAFTLASGSTMTGNVNSGVVNLLASGVQLTGKVTATTSLQMGSGNTITGDVVTGELTLDSSNATIVGNATVNHATLNWAGRATETIYCTAGNTPGQCDCVTNNSGWDIRKNVKSNASGPYCEGKTGTLDHFLIIHPSTASVCAPAQVTVKACANAACTASYTNGTTVFLQPANQRLYIGSTGSASADLALQPTDRLVLSLLRDGAKPPTSCSSSDGATSDCAIKVAKVGLELLLNENQPSDKQSFVAAEEASRMPPLKIRAQIYDDNENACKALFDSGKQTIGLSFYYADPSTGTIQPSIGGTPFTARKEIQMPLEFKNGVAETTLAYEDAGKLVLNASYAGHGWVASGSLGVVAAPAAFTIGTELTAPYFAGKSFVAKVTAINRKGVKTPNFGKELEPVPVRLGGTPCGEGWANGFVAPSAPSAIEGGVQTFAPTPQSDMPRMDETGALYLTAKLDASYLGSGISPTGTTGPPAQPCSAPLGPFIPAYFLLEESADWGRTTQQDGEKRKQYYSGEPAMQWKLSARNLKRDVTVNYTAGRSARDVDLIAIDAAAPAGTTAPTTLGVLGTPKQCVSTASHFVCAEDFVDGVATWIKGSFTFANRQTAPLTAKLRATDTDKASSSYAPKEPKVVVRSGRVRLSNAFGSARQPLSMPFNLEYWDGRAWVRNMDDSTTEFHTPALALPTGAHITPTFGKLVRGAGTILLNRGTATGTTSFPVALNLGTAPKDNACSPLNPKPGSTGADMAFLRSADANCTDAKPHDPWARASFGVFSDETRRIIHVREVFR
nr:polymer-forming cytoskeletal protein [uncultured Massilia sp.]